MGLALALLAWGGGAVAAGEPADGPAGPDGAVLAAVCGGCHGAPTGEPGGIPSLRGLTADEIADRLIAYRSGAEQGTLMNRLARGYTEAEIRLLAGALGNAPE